MMQVLKNFLNNPLRLEGMATSGWYGKTTQQRDIFNLNFSQARSSLRISPTLVHAFKHPHAKHFNFLNLSPVSRSFGIEYDVCVPQFSNMKISAGAVLFFKQTKSTELIKLQRSSQYVVGF